MTLHKRTRAFNSPKRFLIDLGKRVLIFSIPPEIANHSIRHWPTVLYFFKRSILLPSTFGRDS